MEIRYSTLIFANRLANPGRSGYCGGVGYRREHHPELSVYNRVLDLDRIYPPGVSEFCGGDALMRRTVLEQVGGFSEDLIAGEEPELCQRIREQG